MDKLSGHKVVNLRYELLQSIGQGQFGKVLLARDKSVDPAKYYAIKTINRIDTSRLITKTYMSHTTKIKREIRIMKECDHPNVVKLYQVIDDMKYDKILLVLEYCQYGEIDWKRYNHYHEKYFKDGSKSLPLNKILRDVTNGLEYLHKFKHIIHRDLKPSNLLISRDRTIKISDFGVSLILENNANDDKELGKTMGTPAFFAPELCQFVNKRLLMLNDKDLLHSKIDSRIDIWSLGVVLYCLFFHQLPFEGHNEFSLFKNIVNGPLRFPRAVESSKARPQDSKELELLIDLIKKILHKDPSQRPSIEEIKGHPFTVFGLLKEEIESFNAVNRKIFASQGLKVVDTDNSLTGRLRRLFIGKTTEVTASNPIIITEEDLAKAAFVYRDLEKVDDLLDSYLDDSSSMGSLDGDDENNSPAVDTSNLLSTIETASPTKSSVPPVHIETSSTDNLGSKEPNSSSASITSKPGSLKPKSPVKLDSSSTKSISPVKLRNYPLGPGLAVASSGSSKLNAPPPLKLSESNFVSNSSGVSSRSSFELRNVSLSGSRTPVSGGNTITIGAGSPLSLKSMFSPSRRFFAKLKREKKPTIGSLASTEQSDGYTNFEPPPGVGGAPRSSSSRRGLTTSVDSSQSGPWKGRKNSMSSTGLNMLSKLSSSSSSLNLHAYLIEDEGISGFSGASTACNGSLHSDEDASSTSISQLRKNLSNHGDRTREPQGTLVGQRSYRDHSEDYMDSSNDSQGVKDIGKELYYTKNSQSTHIRPGSRKNDSELTFDENSQNDYNDDADRTFSMDEYLDQL